MNKAAIDWADDLHEELAASADEAIAYLNAAVDEHHLPTLLLALRHVAEARGGLDQIAQQTKLNRRGIYRQLAASGNPTMATFQTVLDALGFKMVIQPKQMPTGRAMRRKTA